MPCFCIYNTFKCHFKPNQKCQRDMNDPVSWKTLKKLGIINDHFPCPPEDFQAVKAVEEAEKRWKPKKSVNFGFDNVVYRNAPKAIYFQRV